MASGANDHPSASRRRFLKTVGAAAGAAGLAPVLSAPFVSTALAQTKTLKILQWSHFIPEYDKWIDAFAKDWGKKNGITVTVDHIPHLSFPRARRRRSAPVRGTISSGSTGPGVPIFMPSTSMI